MRRKYEPRSPSRGPLLRLDSCQGLLCVCSFARAAGVATVPKGWWEMTVRYYSQVSDGTIEEHHRQEDAIDSAMLEEDGRYSNRMESNQFGVLIQTGGVSGEILGGYSFSDYEPCRQPVDPLPQIREAFPAIARRLDALDAVEMLLQNSLSNPFEILDIIREAKR